jgi:hypothetical protein
MLKKVECSNKLETNKFLNKEVKNNDLKKAITRTWNSGEGRSCTMILPKKISRRYGLDKPSHVLIEEKINGIFIKKIEV